MGITYKELLLIDYPEKLPNMNCSIRGLGCPDSYNYTVERYCPPGGCENCWGRVAPPVENPREGFSYNSIKLKDNI